MMMLSLQHHHQELLNFDHDSSSFPNVVKYSTVMPSSSSSPLTQSNHLDDNGGVPTVVTQYQTPMSMSYYSESETNEMYRDGNDYHHYPVKSSPSPPSSTFAVDGDGQQPQLPSAYESSTTTSSTSSSSSSSIVESLPTLMPPPEAEAGNGFGYHPQPFIQLNVSVGPSGNVEQQTFPIVYSDHPTTDAAYGQTRMVLVEQPTNRIRYRYRSEKGSHGGLNGVNSSQMKKTYPTIKIENYPPGDNGGGGPVFVRASLATNEEEPRPHVHKLMGRHCSDDGSCTVPLSENCTAVFQNLGILFIGKKEVPEILFQRKVLEWSSRFGETLTEKCRIRLQEESEKEAKDMNLNSVRICFEAFALENDSLYPICAPIYSRPIANQKSPDSGELKIVRLNRFFGTATGGEEIYLLCEKVNKKEIRVRFFELDTVTGAEQWEAYGEFSEADVHHQVAIVFRTPAYRNPGIQKPVQVFLQLYRQRDGEYSEPRIFIYRPAAAATGKPDSNDPDDSDAPSSTTTTGGIATGPTNPKAMMMMMMVSGVDDESVLSRIRMENLPPGHKRRKYSNRNLSGRKITDKNGNHQQTTTSSRKNSTPNNNPPPPVPSSSPMVVVKREISENEIENQIDLLQQPYASSSMAMATNGFDQVNRHHQNHHHSRSPESKMMLVSKHQHLNHHYSSSESQSSPASGHDVSSHLITAPPVMNVTGGNFDHLDSMWTPPSEPSPVEYHPHPNQQGFVSIHAHHSSSPLHHLQPNPHHHTFGLMVDQPPPSSSSQLVVMAPTGSSYHHHHQYGEDHLETTNNIIYHHHQ